MCFTENTIKECKKSHSHTHTPVIKDWLLEAQNGIDSDKKIVNFLVKSTKVRSFNLKQIAF